MIQETGSSFLLHLPSSCATFPCSVLPWVSHPPPLSPLFSIALIGAQTQRIAWPCSFLPSSHPHPMILHLTSPQLSTNSTRMTRGTNTLSYIEFARSGAAVGRRSCFAFPSHTASCLLPPRFYSVQLPITAPPVCATSRVAQGTRTQIAFSILVFYTWPTLPIFELIRTGFSISSSSIILRGDPAQD